MSDFKEFERIAARAREERPARVDVTQRVMRTIQIRERVLVDPFDRQMTFCAALSAAAALIIAVPALDAWMALTDPMPHLFGVVTMVLQ